MKKIISMVIVLSMIVSMIPTAAFAAEADNLCDHHAEHTADCGYVEGVSDCAYHCDVCLVHDNEDEVTEEDTDSPPTCTCETGDPAIHAVGCAAYVAPEKPECKCVEKCTEPNLWCDICGFDYTACTGTDSAVAYADDDITYRYCDENGANWQTGTKVAGNYESVSSSDTVWGTSGTDTWYVAGGEITISSRITVEGNVHLILANGYTLTAEAGIEVNEGNSLTIYGQENGTGTLLATTTTNLNAGIGGTNGASGPITINGGNVQATGGVNGAGIGGGAAGSGTVTINGGTVEAQGGDNGAGIGGGLRGSGNVTINGGNVTAMSNSGAGIGGGYSGSGEVTISGGTVEAQGGVNGAGIGGGYNENNCSGNVTIKGGTVVARGGDRGAGIGGGDNGNGTVIIEGGTVEARGGWSAAGIGGGAVGSGTVTISGGSVTATGNSGGAGIGGGDNGNGTVIIEGGTVEAQGGDHGAGIGGGYDGSGEVTISGGTTIAQGVNGAFNVTPTITGTFNAAVWYGDSEESANEAGPQDISELEENYNKNYVKIACDHSGSQHNTATSNGDGTHSFTCTVCGTESSEACSGGTATCTEKAVCQKCGESYGKFGDHSVDADGKCSCGVQAYNLYVGGEQFTSEKLTINGTTGTATYDPATNTLTLNNYTYTGESYGWSDGDYGAAIYYCGSDTLKLELIGESHITHQSDVFRFETYGIYSIGGIEVFGEGSLTADGGEIKTNEDDDESDSFGVRCADLTVNSGSLTATGDNRGVWCRGDLTVSGGSLTANGTSNYAVICDGDVTVTGGSLNATSNGGNGVICDGDVTVSGGSLTATSNSNHGVWCYGDLTVSGGSLTATGGMSGPYKGVNCRGNIALSGGEVLVKGIPAAFNSDYKGFSCENGYYRNAEDGVFSLWTENSSVGMSSYFAFVGADHVTTEHEDGKHTISCKNADCLLNLSNDETDYTVGYTASGSTITAACSANCGYSETATISATGKTYDGTAVTANVSYSENWTGGNLTIAYAIKDGAALTEAPKDAGTYTASISLGEGENAVTARVDFTIAPCGISSAMITTGGEYYRENGYTADDIEYLFMVNLGSKLLVYGTDYNLILPVDPMIDVGEYNITIKGIGNYTGERTATFEISAKNPTVTTRPSAVQDLTYTGEAQALITAGEATGGTMQYKLGDNTEWSVDIPTATDAGEYVVWWRVVGDKNYSNTDDTRIDVTISKADAIVTKAPEAISGLKFKEENGNEVQQALVTAGVAEGGTMLYRVDGEWSTTIPTDWQARDYTVDYKVEGDSNHNDSAVGSVKVSIAKADAPTVSIPEQQHIYTTTTENRIEIKPLLPSLCAIIDDQSRVTEITGDFIKNADFDNNGVLTYDTVPGTLGATGTIIIKIVMRNYEDATVTVNVKLIDTMPVNNSGTDNAITYDGSTYDVAQMFTIDNNAGAASYTIVGGTGAGELNGSVLTITKAGTIQIKLTTAAQGVYKAGEATATLTVNKADGTGTVSMDGWTYGDTAKAPTTENGTGTATFLYTGNGYSSADVPTDAGTYTVTATFAENDLYEATTATDTFVIEQKELIPAITGNVSKTYDGTTTVPAGLSITLDGKIGNDNVTATASFAYDGVNVGTTKIIATDITLSGETAKNYKLKANDASADVGEITKAKVTITVDTADIVVTYGETVDLPDATTNFGTVSCDKTAADLVNAGTYTVTYTVEGTGNYDGDTKSVIVTVNAKAITEADVELVGTLTYNGNEQTQKITCNNGITYDVAGNTATEAGTYTLTITGNGNYTGEVKLSYTVAKKPISVVWENTNLVYTGSAQSPKAVLAGIVSDDNIQAVVNGSGTNAGTYDATVSLTGADADNYALTGSTKFTIARAPVTFKVSNNSVEEGKNISVAVTSDPANVSHTVTYRQNGSVVTPSEVGEYEIFVEITDSNYRHSASANGDAIKIGVLTIYEGKKPATYTLSYAPGEGSGTMAAEEAALTGTIRILPECTFTAPKDSNNNDMLFVGWSDGNATYKAGEQYRQPEKNVTMTALWVAEEHDIRGRVKQYVSLDSDSTLEIRGGVVVTLMLGSKQVAQAVTDASGDYEFEHCLLGTYNLVAEYEGIRQTAKAILGHSDMEDLEIDLPAGKTNSTVDVEPGTPDVVVGGLDEMMKTTDNKVFTEADKKVVEQGGEVEIKMEVKENPAPEKKDDLEKKAEEISTVTEIGIFIDLDLTKTVTDKDGNTVGEENKVIEEASKLLENIIFLPGHLQNKNVYHVFRDHGGKIEEMTELRSVPTGNTEGFIVDRVNHTITIYSMKYSTYAIAYTDPFTVTFNANGGKVDVESAITGTDGTLEILPTPTRSGYTFKGWFTAESGGTEVTADTVFNADKIIYAQWQMNYVPTPSGGNTNKVTVESPENGSVDADLNNAKEGTTVIITVVPDEGYVLDKLTITDAKGNELKVTSRGNDRYSFVMPDSKVTIAASFVLKGADCIGGDGCLSGQFSDLDTSLWYHKATDYVLSKGLMNGVGGGKFNPNGTTSRAMIVTILWRLEGEPVVNYLMQFEDVAAESWYTEAIRWAASEGIVNGYSDTAFGPNDNITREQLATILYRYEQYKGGGFTGAWMFLLDYTDRDKVSDWAYEAMCWTTMHGVINGKGDGILDPKGNAKRCEAAQMLMNYLNK